MKKFLFLILLSFIALEIKGQTSDKEKILRDYFEAYNQHAIETVLEMVSDDIRVYSVTSDTVTIDIEGKVNLRNWLTNYFQDLPKVSSEISGINEVGNRISFTETAYWGEERSQSSLAVYEIMEGKIRRVWYYY